MEINNKPKRTKPRKVAFYFVYILYIAMFSVFREPLLQVFPFFKEPFSVFMRTNLAK